MKQGISSFFLSFDQKVSPGGRRAFWGRCAAFSSFLCGILDFFFSRIERWFFKHLKELLSRLLHSAGHTECWRKWGWPWAAYSKSALVIMNEIFINPSVAHYTARSHTHAHTQTHTNKQNHNGPSLTVICLQMLVNYIHLSAPTAAGQLSMPFRSS